MGRERERDGRTNGRTAALLNAPLWARHNIAVTFAAFVILMHYLPFIL